MSKSTMKERLQKYTELLTEIKIEERRLNALKDDGTITYRRARAGIEDNIKKLLEAEWAEYEALTDIINALPSVEQRQVMMARYLDGQNWKAITAAIFGDCPDFAEKNES
ncbi:MAG: hypothetical protein IKW41_00355, partial [Phascolarctobacterium sp.]|nr:hypothetical protein [Phascolarctobacterium sp.]